MATTVTVAPRGNPGPPALQEVFALTSDVTTLGRCTAVVGSPDAPR